MSEGTTAPIGPKTVTILGSHWKDSAPWSGFDFAKAEIRTGSIWSFDDYNLAVPWMHPDDRARGYSDDPEMWGTYRLRLKRGWKRFVNTGGKWLVSKDGNTP